MSEDYKYYLEQLPHSLALFKQVQPEGSCFVESDQWLRWSFSRVAWEYCEPYAGNPRREIRAEEARAFVLKGYQERAQSYARHAVYVEEK